MSARYPGRHRCVLLDTNIWIYHFEGHSAFGAAAARVLAAVEAGKLTGVTSELTLLELTVKPLQLGRQDVADEYELLLSHFPNLRLLPVTREILVAAAALRAAHRLRTPDAIQLASGMRAGATIAASNDEQWRKLPMIKCAPLAEW